MVKKEATNNASDPYVKLMKTWEKSENLEKNRVFRSKMACLRGKGRQLAVW